MITMMRLPIRKGNVPLRVARGHFATNHSHINYYIDITNQKTRLNEAQDSARQLVKNFINDTPVDTILCLDGTAVLGTCVAQELTRVGAPLGPSSCVSGEQGLQESTHSLSCAPKLCIQEL